MVTASLNQPLPDGLIAVRKPQTFRTMFVRQFLKNRGAVVGTFVLAIVVIAALMAPLIAPYGPLTMHAQDRLVAPSEKYLFGSDQYGRDILSRIIWGGRISLQIGIIANAFAGSLGLVVGLASGYYGGALDLVLMRIMDMIFAFPSILLALSIIGLIGKRSLTWVMIALAITWIPVYARLIRGSVLSVKGMAYVEAARVVGMSDVRIALRHVLPNVIAPVIVVMTLLVGVAIRNAAALSFLGMGAQPPTPEWGLMLFETKQFMRLAPWVTIFPGLAILVTVMAFNLIGDGLRTALDPRMKID
jgi:peptide/nickel transport system permease protein